MQNIYIYIFFIPFLLKIYIYIYIFLIKTYMQNIYIYIFCIPRRERAGSLGKDGVGERIINGRIIDAAPLSFLFRLNFIFAPPA